MKWLVFWSIFFHLFSAPSGTVWNFPNDARAPEPPLIAHGKRTKQSPPQV
jgi:hypothetical protein